MRRSVFFCLTVFLAIVAVLLLSEAALRTARRYTCTEPPFLHYRFDEHVGWRHVENDAGWALGCAGSAVEYRTFVEFNAHGHRGPDLGYARNEGLLRVLFLGDSVTEAVQVPFEDTFVRHSERALTESYAAVEAINTGVASWGTDNQLLYFRTEGRLYRPDLVVLIANLQNDVLENSADLYRRAYVSVGREPAAKPLAILTSDGRVDFDRTWLNEKKARDGDERIGLAQRAWRWLEANFYLIRLVERLCAPTEQFQPKASKPESMPTHHEAFLVPPSGEWERAWQLTDALIRTLDEEVRAVGSRLLVVVMPSKLASDPAQRRRIERLFSGWKAGGWDLDYPTARMLAMLDDAGIDHLDMTPILRTEAGEPQPFLLSEVHLSVAGHRVVAEALTPAIAQRLGLVARDRGAPPLDAD